MSDFVEIHGFADFVFSSHPDWWLAKNLLTKETGYVPFNYITSIDNLEIKE
jgi:hypothetical protein